MSNNRNRIELTYNARKINPQDFTEEFTPAEKLKEEGLEQSRHLFAIFGLLKMVELDNWDHDKEDLNNVLRNISELGYQLSNNIFSSVDTLYDLHEQTINELKEGVILFDK